MLCETSHITAVAAALKPTVAAAANFNCSTRHPSVDATARDHASLPVSFPVVQLRCTHSPERCLSTLRSPASTTEAPTDRLPLGWEAFDGLRNMSMSGRHHPAGGGTKHLPADGGAKCLLGLFSQETTATGQCSQTSQRLSLHREVQSHKVAGFFRAEKETLVSRSFPQLISLSPARRCC